MTQPFSADEAAPIDRSHIAGVRARYRRASDAELQDFAAAGRENFSPWAWDLLEEALAQRGVAPDAAVEEALAPDALVPAESDGPQSISYPKPLFGHRVLALAIDSLVIAAGNLPVFIWSEATDETIVSSRLLALRLLLGAGWALYYSFTKDGWAGGQSLGKKVMGLMVVNLTTNRPCSWRESAKRNVVLFMLGIIPVGSLIEPVAAAVTRDGRRLGDRFAGTQVIEVADYEPGV